MAACFFVVLGLNSSDNDSVVELYSGNNDDSIVSCNEVIPLQWHCSGPSLPEATDLLPDNTTHFYYQALESETTVRLTQANFSRLRQLEEFHLSSVDPSYQQIEEIKPDKTDIFLGLSRLRELRLNTIWLLHHPLPDLFKPLINLELLDLSNTYNIEFDNLAPTLSGLKSNRKLKHLNLWNIKKFTQVDPIMTLDLAEILLHLKDVPLEYLNIGYNALKRITPPGLLRYAPRLKELDARNNMMNTMISSALYLEANLHPTLEILRLDQQLYRPTRTKRNGYRGIAGFPKCPLLEDNPQMSYLRARFQSNHTEFCLYLYQHDASSFHGVPCEYIPPFDELVVANCSGCQVIPITGSIKQMYMSQMNVYDEVQVHPGYRTEPQCFHRGNSLQLIDLSYNYDFGWLGISDLAENEVIGVEKLELMNISNSGLVRLNPKFFWNFPQLRWVDMSHNFLQMKNASATFKSNAKLLHVDFSFNLIDNLDNDLFKPLVSLQHLNLSFNRIEHFTLDLSRLKSLSIIDLSGNKITALENSITLQLNEIAANAPMSLNLSQNAFICTCPSLEFIKWINRDHHENLKLEGYDDYMCRNRESKLDFISKVRISSIQRECDIWIIYISIGVGSAVSVLLIVVIVVLIYKKRWRIRYLLFLARTAWKRRNEVRVDVHYDYDAFISYNEEDRFWVHDNLRPILEDERGLKVCLHFRDFVPGEFIEDEIIKSITSSRKTVLILSPNFVKSKWCFFEMQMARNRLFEEGSDVLILVMLAEIKRSEITSTLAHLLDTKVYLQWTQDPDGQKLFWAKLADVIQKPRQNDLA